MGTIGAVWGVIGVLVLFAQAVVRLGPIALEPLCDGIGGAEVALYVASIVLSGWSEGYRAFQLAFSPRVVARAAALARRPNALHALFAPLYVMGLLHATRRRLVTSWVTLVGVVTLIALVRRVPQPYRGAIDAGVVLALVWGAAVIVVHAIRAAKGRVPKVPDDLPAAVPPAARGV